MFYRWILPDLTRPLSDEQFKNSVCGFCCTDHLGFCPLIKRIEYHSNGNLAYIEMRDRDE